MSIPGRKMAPARTPRAPGLDEGRRVYRVARYARRPAQSVSDAVTRAAGRGGSEHCRPGPERLNLTGEDSIMVAGTALPW